MSDKASIAARAANRGMLGKLVVIVLVMFGFGYALVPMYRAICDALGINVLSVTEQRARQWLTGAGGEPRNTQVDRSRVVTVEVDSNVRGPWDFAPAVTSMQVHPGELATVMYEFRNRQDRTMAAQAIPSYAPRHAAGHFDKLECFCFNEYTLAPGERKSWPVAFVIDPRLPRDVTTITLSYTFFEVGGRTPPAGAAAAAISAAPVPAADASPREAS